MSNKEKTPKKAREIIKELTKKLRINKGRKGRANG
jgi:hypothetical protein